MTVTRRNALAAASLGAGGLLLAACSGNSTAVSPSTTAADASDSAAADPTANAANAGTVLTALSAVPVGGAVSATGKGGAKLIVAQPTKGEVVAFSAICTHQGCTVTPAKSTLYCGCHEAVFNTDTGAVISGPAPSPLPKVAVTISGTNVVQA